MLRITFWNGNKSTARKAYETELLEACLKAGGGPESSQLHIDDTDYPSAEDEGNIFAKGADILVTVAGNVKFKDRPKIVIEQPLAKGLLGYRLLIVREELLPKFRKTDSFDLLRNLSIGIPETWADAELFRQNGFRVVEKGGFQDLFKLLKAGEFDYTALGVNEIEAVFKEQVQPLGGMCIEPSILIIYPFPLVFYVHPELPALAERVESGLRKIKSSGDFDRLFGKHHGDIVKRLNLRRRQRLELVNPALPESMEAFRSSLLD